MSRARPEDTIIPSEYKTNPERFYANLRKLALIVLHNHYNYVRDEDTQEELISCAIFKAINLVLDGGYDENRSNLRTYLYSGMRNEMQNHMYKGSKLICVDEIYYDQDTGYYDSPDPEVNEDLIYEICDKFDRLGNYHNALIRELKKYGIRGELTDLEEPTSINPKVLDAIFAEYVWRAG